MKRAVFTTILTLLATMFAATAIATNKGQEKDNNQATLFIGTFGEGIYSCLYNPQNGELADIRLETKARNAAFMTISADKKFMYSYHTAKDGKIWLLSFKIGDDKRTLITTDSVETFSGDPCHIKLIDNERKIAAACYGDGKVIYCNIDKNGHFMGSVKTINHNTDIPKPADKKSHAHQINTDNKHKYVYVPDLGLDRVIIYQVSKDKLVYIGEIPAAEGAGPRHMAFHPSGKYMALVCELNSTVVLYELDSKGMFTEPLQRLSTLPEEYNGQKSAADIHFSPDGKRIYASERGLSSIVCYNLNVQTGKMDKFASLTGGIDMPRNFGIDNSGKYIIVGNLSNNNVSSYNANNAFKDNSSSIVSDTKTELESSTNENNSKITSESNHQNPISVMQVSSPSCVLILE